MLCSTFLRAVLLFRSPEFKKIHETSRRQSINQLINKNMNLAATEYNSIASTASDFQKVLLLVDYRNTNSHMSSTSHYF